ncbi:MAG: CehA/McbA family metallohydrolase [Armatimonadetes bacterium]|nr:CehA/McbA family metallohydrolase [Armatimonadota bacterium]
MLDVLAAFRRPGRWYRGNVHCHSTASDGRLSITDRFAAYRDAGYDFLVLTDHRKVSDVSACSDGDFLAISGSEIHPPNPYGGDRYHIVAINIHERIPDEEMHPNEAIAAILSQGGEAVICHPYWCGHTFQDLAPLRGYLAVEVYNDTCMGIGRGYSESHWDELLDHVGPCWGMATDDAHGTEHDCFHAWVMVHAPELSLAAILESLRQGHFYSTQGPAFEHMEMRTTEVPDADDGVRVVPALAIRTSPVQAICFMGHRWRGKRVLASEGSALVEAEYPILNGEKYVRVEIVDERGRKAWSQPVFLNAESL